MELSSALEEIGKVIRNHRETLETEEAAKTTLVMPFLRALGYNVFDPGEVVPEFVADIGTKRGEKVDYAICRNDEILMLLECKSARVELKIENASQLYRYFGASDVRIAVLTNGVIYQFYSDIEAPNKMDRSPFFTCRLDELAPQDVETLSRFSKSEFDIEQIKSIAGRLKLQTTVRGKLEAEIANPSGEMVRAVSAGIYDGRLTSQVVDRFKTAIKVAMRGIIRDEVNKRLQMALRDPASLDSPDFLEPESEIETTEVERDGFRIVQAIGAEQVEVDRIVMRDAKSYCAILLDDNNRKTIARLHFNSDTARYLGTFKGKEETRHSMSDPADIYRYRKEIKARIAELIA